MHSSIATFATLALLPLLAACGDQATSATSKPERPVQVQHVAFQSDDASREFVGVVRARYETDLGFRVAGKITARIVNVGDRVHAGDVIARLDPQDPQLQVESARGRAVCSHVESRPDSVRRAALRELEVTRLCDGRRLRTQESGEGRGGGPARTRAAGARPRSQPARLCGAQGRGRRRHHRDPRRARAGRRHRTGGRAACAPRRDGSRCRAAGDLAWRGARIAGDGQTLGRAGTAVRRAAARTVAASRPADPHLCGALHRSKIPTTQSRSA